MSEFQIQLAIYVTNIFSPISLILLCIFGITMSFLYLDIKQIRFKEIFSVNCPNNIKGIYIISLSIMISGIFSQTIKYIYKTPRPINMLVSETGYSFLSGHSAMIFAFSFTIIFLLFKYFRDHRFYINYLHSIFFTLIAVLVSFSRLILQVHRIIDVVAGCFIGLISTYIAVKIYYPFVKKIDKRIF